MSEPASGAAIRGKAAVLAEYADAVGVGVGEMEDVTWKVRAVPPDMGHHHCGATRWLGAELRRLRLELGISQRRLTQLIGLSAHSNLGDYERGRRIPPCDIVIACERLLAVP